MARILLVLAGLNVLAVPVAEAQDEPGRVERIPSESTDPVDVAVAFSRFRFECTPSGGDDCPYGVNIARRDDFADALASGVLRAGGPGARQGQPLLLTDPAELSLAVRSEIERFQGDEGALSATILGGPGAVSEDVADELRAMGLEVDRIGGGDRIATAVEIARRAFPPNDPSGFDYGFDVMLARGYGSEENPTAAFADALTAGSYSAATQRPLLLTETDRLSPETENHLLETLADDREGHRIDEILVIGGPAAVGEPVVARLEELGVTVRRLAGADRAETAVEVARRPPVEAQTAAEMGALTLIEGYTDTAWASGLSARGYLVLSNGGALPAATAALLDTGDDTTDLYCAPLVSEAACDAAAERLHAN